MPDNQDINSVFEDIISGLRENAAEICVLPVKDFLGEGLAFLKKVSGGKFDAYELKSPEAGDITLDTNIEIENSASMIKKTLRQVIRADGGMFTNNADADNSAQAIDPYIPSPAEHEKAAAYADENASKIGQPRTMTEQETRELWQETYNDYLALVKLKENYTADINPAATPTNAAAALTAIAKEAALQGMIAIRPAMENPTAAQGAVLAGLQQGLQLRAEELQQAQSLAAPFLHGLAYLRDMSAGALEISAEPAADSSAIIVQIRAPDFARFIKITANGKAQLGERNKTDFHSFNFEAMEETHINALLGAIARDAVFAGKIPATSGQETAADAEQEAVLRAIRQAEGERGMARIAAGCLAEELTAQPGQKSGLRIDTVESAAGADVTLALTHKNGDSTQVIVNGNGCVKRDKEYNVFNPIALAALLDMIKNDIQPQRRVPDKPTVAYRP